MSDIPHCDSPGFDDPQSRDAQIQPQASVGTVAVTEKSFPKESSSINPNKKWTKARSDYTLATGVDVAESVKTFESQLQDLDKQLRELSNRARKLGGSVGILAASTRLREQIGRVSWVFRKNAAGLFPQKVLEPDKFQPSVFRRLVSKRGSFFDRIFSQSTKLKPKDIALELQFFAQDIRTLTECFDQFPEFIDETPDRVFSEELLQWAVELKNFEDGFDDVAAQLYLFYSMEDIGNGLKPLMAKFIPFFLETGISTVKASQKHSFDNSQNLSTVATLFAGVAASMIQTTTGSDWPRTTLFDCVNILWFISLIFSISAAVNSLLGLTWNEAIYRSPNYRVPWWVLIWIKHSPIIYLVLSVICFFIGFVLFSFASDQPNITRILTAVFVCASCCGLLVLSSWFASERWIYYRYEGYMWLSDSLDIALFKPIRKYSVSMVHSIRSQNIFARRNGLVDPNQANTDPENPGEAEPGIGHRERQKTQGTEPHDQDKSAPFWESVDKTRMTAQEIAQHRWNEAIGRTIKAHRERSMSFICSMTECSAQLARMTISWSLSNEHDAIVRFLQFSPDGKYLVTSSWDRRSLILEVVANGLRKKPLQQQSSRYGFVCQIRWSAECDRLLIRQNKSLSAWDMDGNCLWSRPTDGEQHSVRSAAWNGRNRALCVEGNRIVEVDHSGKDIRHHDIHNFVIRHIVVMNNSRHMLSIGKHDYAHHADKLGKSSKKKHEIILHDRTNFNIIKRAPVFHEMCDLTVDRKEQYALVSFRNRNPPQLWKLRNAQDEAGHLALRCTYTPNVSTSFAGVPAIFGGTHDELILRAGTANEIYIWDRDSTVQLHRIQTPVTLGMLTAIAWNYGARDQWMFATGTHDGEVHVWTVVEVAQSSGSSKGSSSGGDGDVTPAVAAAESTQDVIAEPAPLRPYGPMQQYSGESSSTAYSTTDLNDDEDST